MDSRFRLLRRRLGYLSETTPEREPVSKKEEISLPGWERIGEHTFRRSCQVDLQPGCSRPACELLPGGCAAGDLLFFDLETTGLSGGAGTVVFLAGFARIEREKLRAEQLFLSDYPGEPDFLEGIRRILRPGAVLVSYNGRAFDAPLLKTRFRLQRIELDLSKQLDLLAWARRLWRGRLAECSLGTVEREVLGLFREGDIPGNEVPLRYFDFLRNRDPKVLDPVFEHNRRDVLTLVSLWERIEALWSGETLPGEPSDLLRLGRCLLRQGEARGESLLRKALEMGNHESGKLISLRRKQERDWETAASIWKELASGLRPEGRFPLEFRDPGVFAVLELAKYYEHRRRDFTEALTWVRRLSGAGRTLSPGLRFDLDHRERRLLRKLGSGGAPI